MRRAVGGAYEVSARDTFSRSVSLSHTFSPTRSLSISVSVSSSARISLSLPLFLSHSLSLSLSIALFILLSLCLSLSTSLFISLSVYSVSSVLRGLYRGGTAVIIITCCVHNDIHGRRPWIINNYGSSGRKTLFTLKLTTRAAPRTQTNRPDAFTLHGIILLLFYTCTLYNNTTIYIHENRSRSLCRPVSVFPRKNRRFRFTPLEKVRRDRGGT